MDPDLPDLLAAARGDGPADADRLAELLARVRTDAAFRAAYVAEVRMLGKLKAVQSAEPRWLELDDALGGAEPAPVAFEDRVMGRLPPAPRRVWPWAALAASLLAGVAVAVTVLPRPNPVAPPGREPPAFLAVVVKAEAEWENEGDRYPADGNPLPAGRYVMRGGRATLTMFNGVTLTIDGPADFDLTTPEQVFCRRGRLRARVPAGAEGFVVRAPGAAVADLGTEFAVTVDESGAIDVMVFEGRAEASVLNADGHTLRSEVVEARRAVRLDPAAGRIHDAPAAADHFAAAPDLVAPDLGVGDAYAAAVRASRPWGYWRCGELADGVVANDIAGGPPLRATGGIRVVGADAHRSLRFPPPVGRGEQYLVMDGGWTPPRGGGYAVELWAMSEGVGVGTLVGLTARADEPAQKHVFLLELAGRGHHLVHDPCTARVLDRWPPAQTGGVNAFSRQMYVPYRWHHFVGRRTPAGLEVYMDGERVGVSPVDPGDASAACRLMVGRLKQGTQANVDQERPFVGRLAELAVYDHPLDPAEIRRHHDLGARRR